MTQQPAPPRRDRFRTGSAWAALATTPLWFGLAFFIGEGLTYQLGYGIGTDDPPGLVSVGIYIAAFAPFVIAQVLAIRWGLAGRRHGERAGWIPVTIAATVLVWLAYILWANAIN